MAAENRALIAAAPTRIETDENGRSWQVRTLPPVIVAPPTTNV